MIPRSSSFAVLNRYLGNKKDLLGEIADVVGTCAPAGGTVCDIFSGTLAVSLELKRLGYKVVANDINLFSSVYGRAFLINSEVPVFDLAELIPTGRRACLLTQAAQQTDSLKETPGFRFLAEPAMEDRFRILTALVAFLQTADESDLPSSMRRTDMHDSYSEAGRYSEFLSLRGQRGRRRFFTSQNAARIDVVLNYLRWWRRSSVVTDAGYATLLTVLMNAVERVSNTQGTYHDFPRREFDQRALKPLRLVPPPFDGIVGRPPAPLIGTAEDSLQFIERVPRHDVLYIDPPYNFRQYTSYYFLLNLISKYADIDDLDEYFGELRYVRGQNMRDNFVSTFCKARQFIPSLAELISKADAKWVLLSYFSGRNHWNRFDSPDNDVGLTKVRELFADEVLFERDSCSVVPVARLNYQSYGGYRARMVNEYLVLGRKAS